MKKIKRIVALMLISVLALGMLSGCGTKDESDNNGQTVTGTNKTDTDKTDSNKTDTNKTDTNETDTNEKITLGVCQLAVHDALDASYNGFIDGLAEAGYVKGENLEVIYDVAAGEKANCQTIANKFASLDVDMILAIATDAAQACANATKDIPILITAVTDPEVSGIVVSNANPGGNVTGTSDLTPVKRQMEMITQLLPEAKKIAVLYCSNESNSEIQANLAVKEAKNLGFETMIATVSQTSEIQTVVESLVGKADVIYSPTDNMIAANMETVAMIANANNMPVICGEESMVSKGGLATYGINYYNLGKQTAAMAVKVLKGEASTESMPIEYLEETVFSYNEEVAQMLGITIPEELLNEMAK